MLARVEDLPGAALEVDHVVAIVVHKVVEVLLDHLKGGLQHGTLFGSQAALAFLDVLSRRTN